MARQKNVPCAGCGEFLWTGKGCLPAGQATCRACRNARNPTASISCEQCGISFIGKAYRRFCSVTCNNRNLNQARRSVDTRRCLACSVAFTCKPSSKRRFCSQLCGVRYRSAPSSPITWRECDVCTAWFVSRRNNLRCSDKCRSAAADAYVDRTAERILGLYRLATRGGIDIPRACAWRRSLTEYLARRDSNCCAICTEPIDLTLPSGPRGSDFGPSIDHVIPVSRGGEDSLANVRLTHWKCNRDRGNRGGGEQLRLVG